MPPWLHSLPRAACESTNVCNLPLQKGFPSTSSTKGAGQDAASGLAPFRESQPCCISQPPRPASPTHTQQLHAKIPNNIANVHRATQQSSASLAAWTITRGYVETTDEKQSDPAPDPKIIQHQPWRRSGGLLNCTAKSTCHSGSEIEVKDQGQPMTGPSGKPGSEQKPQTEPEPETQPGSQAHRLIQNPENICLHEVGGSTAQQQAQNVQSTPVCSDASLRKPHVISDDLLISAQEQSNGQQNKIVPTFVTTKGAGIVTEEEQATCSFECSPQTRVCTGTRLEGRSKASFQPPAILSVIERAAKQWKAG